MGGTSLPCSSGVLCVSRFQVKGQRDGYGFARDLTVRYNFSTSTIKTVILFVLQIYDPTKKWERYTIHGDQLGHGLQPRSDRVLPWVLFMRKGNFPALLCNYVMRSITINFLNFFCWCLPCEILDIQFKCVGGNLLVLLLVRQQHSYFYRRFPAFSCITILILCPRLKTAHERSLSNLVPRVSVFEGFCHMLPTSQALSIGRRPVLLQTWT